MHKHSKLRDQDSSRCLPQNWNLLLGQAKVEKVLQNAT